ncbi:hypothetical protein [Spiroplasma alleghenense]|uniref:Uncharacterized protein n=1 Tax=Spiroplasma alleghenense TaxID=216931 RepID=A0A345Z2G1_9MOLU|nr:hypothetical protein [Spiroplasma alleghenense]AXK50790.1 hypothetical protein SALLE_v1c01140 [Spiroplasma alleghenense]
MKKASKILTIVGTSISVVLALIGMILGIVGITVASDESVAVKGIAMVLFIGLSIAGMILPLLALIFVLMKSTKLNFVGYILAIVTGGFAVLGMLLSGVGVITLLSLASGVATLVGGILGVVSAKK